jgi:hypothetical protein
MRRILALLLFAALTAPASARMHAPYRGHRILPAGALLDGGGSFSTAVTGAYSFRKLRSAYAGPAIRLRRASDNAELDINFLGCTGFTGCPWDEAAALAHCVSTTCFLRTWYDQSGLAKDIGNPTGGTQPALIFNCNGTLPCARAVGAQSLFTVATYTSAAPVSLSSVGKRAVNGGGNAECRWINANGAAGNRLGTFAAPWYLSGTGSLAAVPTPSDGAWHAQQGVINGASSVINVDGTETTGAVTLVATAGAVTISGNTAGTTCEFAEAIAWDAYAVLPAERAALRNNQKSYWGTP